jgi:hypothetical protein
MLTENADHFDARCSFVFSKCRHDNDRKNPRTPKNIYDLNRRMAERMEQIFLSRGIPVIPTIGEPFRNPPFGDFSTNTTLFDSYRGQGTMTFGVRVFRLLYFHYLLVESRLCHSTGMFTRDSDFTDFIMCLRDALYTHVFFLQLTYVTGRHPVVFISIAKCDMADALFLFFFGRATEHHDPR